ncbi:hypothetical protein ACTFIU_006492 [Dictyostelium citrinum]
MANHFKRSLLNHPITKDILPPNIKSLSFSSHFNNQLIKDLIPASVGSLTLGSHFNQTINKQSLQPNLKSINLGNSFNIPLERDSLPSSLETLILVDEFNQIVQLFLFFVVLVLVFETLLVGDDDGGVQSCSLHCMKKYKKEKLTREKHNINNVLNYYL